MKPTDTATAKDKIIIMIIVFMVVLFFAFNVLYNQRKFNKERVFSQCSYVCNSVDGLSYEDCMELCYYIPFNTRNL